MSRKYTLALVLMAAGSSTRFTEGLARSKRIKKQWLRIRDLPLWKKVVNEAKQCYEFDEIIICGEDSELFYMQNFCDEERLVCGGDSRAASLRSALKEVKSDYIFVSDVARCDLDKEVCLRLLDRFWEWDCSVAYLPCTDTAIYENECIPRENLKLIQTPQISKTELIRQYLSMKDYTDESSAMLEHGANVRFIPGSVRMQKVTFLHDLEILLRNSDKFLPPIDDIFVGNGIDIHGFEKGKEMWLGGVRIQSDMGFKAHSDGDVLLHAVIDALLGAIGAGDIGEWFPDNKEEFSGVDSKKLLIKVAEFVTSVGYEINNLDVSILAERPKITPYKDAIKNSLASLLDMPKYRINIKATTSEKMGFIGRGEGVCVMASVGVKFINWTKLKG